eukprot:scaffold31161_cov84-Isochrysis_galbana.AAC.1
MTPPPPVLQVWPGAGDGGHQEGWLRRQVHGWTGRGRLRVQGQGHPQRRGVCAESESAGAHTQRSSAPTHLHPRPSLLGHPHTPSRETGIAPVPSPPALAPNPSPCGTGLSV